MLLDATGWKAVFKAIGSERTYGVATVVFWKLTPEGRATGVVNMPTGLTVAEEDPTFIGYLEPEETLADFLKSNPLFWGEWDDEEEVLLDVRTGLPIYMDELEDPET